MSDNLCFMPATELAAAIRAKTVSPVDVVDAVLSRIERLNPILNAYCTVTAEYARETARMAEAAVMRGEPLGPLHGVPMSIKDLLITNGVRTMRGSKVYEWYVPNEDAPVVERLTAAGAILLGKTTTPEFGWKGTTESPVTGITRNPWKTDVTPGGSSGGAGAAVAAGLGPLAIGTDGGGSIRIPSSFCGIYGLKPSFGRVPVYPPSAVELLSHVGPMTRTVRDAALMLSVIAGPDERDRNSLPGGTTDYLAGIDGGIRGLRVAWSPDLGYATVDPEVAQLTEAAARAFSDLGCPVEETHPGFENPEPIFGTMWLGGFRAALSKELPQWGAQMDPGLVQFLQQGGPMTAVEYVEATFKRTDLWHVVRRFFQRYDLLLTPAVAVPPFPVGVDAPTEIAGQRVSWAGWTPFTYPFNLTGQPAATVPCGWTATGLPVGLQIVGRRHDDATVLRASAAFEAARPWADKRPTL